MFATLNANFDRNYYPKEIPLKILTATDGHGHILYSTAQWLGFVHEGKPFKLEEIPYYPKKTFRITNPYLERAFALNKTKTGCYVMDVYHGTVSRNINSILQNNFNWRLAGTSRGVKHGKGVSFSPRKDFAKKFCRGYGKIIFEAKIMYRSVIVGYVGDILPRNDADTTRSPNGNVYVKFEDNHFLPLYLTYDSDTTDLCSGFHSLKIF